MTSRVHRRVIWRGAQLVVMVAPSEWSPTLLRLTGGGSQRRDCPNAEEGVVSMLLGRSETFSGSIRQAGASSTSGTGGPASLNRPTEGTTHSPLPPVPASATTGLLSRP
jgi:hypothetical protein